MSDFFHLWWSDWASFLHMGRHGLYVWGSVAATVVALTGEQQALRLRAQRLRRAQVTQEMSE
jgi:heme exporter protein CcmD